MQIIQQRSARPDRWPALPAVDIDLDQPRLLVDYDNWLSHRVTLAEAANLQVGLVLSAAIDPAVIDQSFLQLALIKVVFEGFNDGRGFSIAQILRNQIGYRGELRAANVVKENIAMLERCGFDSFELVDGTDLEQAIALFDQLKPAAV